MTGLALSSDAFATRIGERFTMALENGGVLALVLTDCVESDGSDASFTLTFHAGPDAPGQGTYLLAADGLAPTAVFLVPSRPLSDGGLEYHATFDRRPLEPEGRDSL